MTHLEPCYLEELTKRIVKSQEFSFEAGISLHHAELGDFIYSYGKYSEEVLNDCSLNADHIMTMAFLLGLIREHLDDDTISTWYDAGEGVWRVVFPDASMVHEYGHGLYEGEAVSRCLCGIWGLGVMDAPTEVLRNHKTYFISGHLDLTQEEFDLYYAPRINSVMQEAKWFVVGDARGTDSMAQSYLKLNGAKNVTVFHMFESPRNNPGFPTMGGFDGDDDRDAAMTRVSDEDIAWVRPGRDRSGTAANLARRTKLKQDS